jgi:hypothetical protein
MARRDPMDYMKRFGERYWLFHIKDVPRLGAGARHERIQDRPERRVCRKNTGRPSWVGNHLPLPAVRRRATTVRLTIHIIKPRIRANIPENLKTPAIVSSLLVLPFMILELVNRRGFNEGFPIVLFGLLWLLPLGFVAILMPILRSLPAGNRNMQSAFSLLPRVALLILIAWLWVGLILDQMPCFLDVPNCD